uniref:Uncharacterized protein n=1 Tax=Rhizophora mucronata TaxID=61149 RepID=A0A2P2MXV8_RHIMU
MQKINHQERGRMEGKESCHMWILLVQSQTSVKRIRMHERGLLIFDSHSYLVLAPQFSQK